MIKFYLHRLLGERAMKQIELSRKSGVRNPTVNAMYNNYIRRINKEDLDKICKTLGCRLDELIQYIPDKE